MSRFSIGQMNQLGDSLERAGYSAEDVYRLQSDRSLLEELKSVINKRSKIVPIELADFKVFKTAKLSPDFDIYRDLFKRECITNRVYDPMQAAREYFVVEEEIELDLVLTTVAELGFPNGAKMDEIYSRAKELGLELCPPQLGPQLRVQYYEQPQEHSVYIAMELIKIGDHQAHFRLSRSKYNSVPVFDLCYCDENPLYCDQSASQVYRPDTRWVFVKPREPREPRKPEFQVWKTIKLGTGLQTPDDFLSALGKARCETDGKSSEMLVKPDFQPASEEVEVDLVVVWPKELGLTDSEVSLGQLYDRARELGLELCPSEVGPQLKLQYLDQRNGEWLFVAMEPIACSDGLLYLFSPRRNANAHFLTSDSYKSLESTLHSGCRFLFVKPRKG